PDLEPLITIGAYHSAMPDPNWSARLSGRPTGDRPPATPLSEDVLERFDAGAFLPLTKLDVEGRLDRAPGGVEHGPEDHAAHDIEDGQAGDRSGIVGGEADHAEDQRQQPVGDDDDDEDAEHGALGPLGQLAAARQRSEHAVALDDQGRDRDRPHQEQDDPGDDQQDEAEHDPERGHDR